ncbi:sialate O-acetylesterase [Sinomicrobium soli]|uniref:sialate O-acetylesterase n=1 Tax=Sinomicrobium sp. N-1-3-6 TaxID=2219864 RepID=UPI000DCCE085|nr:sialate O-acetylesterase [Sinomicrobium sp. N-1-3-6]RAV30344.1 acetyl xylan esterase [Sinomicrobium sp. N-1-3-6]
MKTRTTTLLICVLTLMCSAFVSGQEEEGKHLFILSGQVNMALFDYESFFTPLVEEEFGKDNVIVVRSALGGQAIRRWYKDWKPLTGNEPKAQPALFRAIFNEVNPLIKGQDLKTVTVIWMGGETDAEEGFGNVYERSLKGLFQQFRDQLKREDINVVIGRLNDFGSDKKKEYVDWDMIRDIQVKVAESDDRYDWVDTDDLNDGRDENVLKIRPHNYQTLGERLFEKAIALIEKNKG